MHQIFSLAHDWSKRVTRLNHYPSQNWGILHQNTDEIFTTHLMRQFSLTKSIEMSN